MSKTKQKCTLCHLLARTKRRSDEGGDWFTCFNHDALIDGTGVMKVEWEPPVAPSEVELAYKQGYLEAEEMCTKVWTEKLDQLSKERAKTVTRFEIIDWRDYGGELDKGGQIFGVHGVSIQLDYQDDDRTLKVFLTDLDKKGRQ